MAFTDILLGIFLIWGLYKGLKNGLLVELASIIALIAGIYGAFKFSYYAAAYLATLTEWNEQYINLAAFLITFIVIVVVIHLAARLLTRVAAFAMLGWLNRIAGAIFGVLKMAVIMGVILVAVERANRSFRFMDEESKENSLLFGPVRDIGALVIDQFTGNEKVPEAQEMHSL